MTQVLKVSKGCVDELLADKEKVLFFHYDYRKKNLLLILITFIQVSTHYALKLIETCFYGIFRLQKNEI